MRRLTQILAWRLREARGLKRARLCLGGVLWAEDALEARAGELDADEALALCGSIDDVDYAALGGEVRFGAAGGVVRKRNPDLEGVADSDVETSHEGGAAAA